MNYEELKKEIMVLMNKYYENSVPLVDIRAALRSVDLIMEQYGAFEAVQMIKKVNQHD